MELAANSPGSLGRPDFGAAVSAVPTFPSAALPRRVVYRAYANEASNFSLPTNAGLRPVRYESRSLVLEETHQALEVVANSKGIRIECGKSGRLDLVIDHGDGDGDTSRMALRVFTDHMEELLEQHSPFVKYHPYLQGALEVLTEVKRERVTPGHVPLADADAEQPVTSVGVASGTRVLEFFDKLLAHYRSDIFGKQLERHIERVAMVKTGLMEVLNDQLATNAGGYLLRLDASLPFTLGVAYDPGRQVATGGANDGKRLAAAKRNFLNRLRHQYFGKRLLSAFAAVTEFFPGRGYNLHWFFFLNSGAVRDRAAHVDHLSMLWKAVAGDGALITDSEKSGNVFKRIASGEISPGNVEFIQHYELSAEYLANAATLHRAVCQGKLRVFSSTQI